VTGLMREISYRDFFRDHASASSPVRRRRSPKRALRARAYVRSPPIYTHAVEAVTAQKQSTL